MATPLTATHRVQVPYLVPGLPNHHLRILCSASPDLTSTLGWSLHNRAAGLIHVEDAFAYLMPLLKDCFDGSVNVGNPELQQFVSGAYPTVVVGTGGALGTGALAPVLTQQASATFTTQALTENMRIQLMETGGSAANLSGKFLTESAITPTGNKNFVGGFTDSVGANSMFQWTQNRGSNFITGFISLVYVQNKNSRRKRGLA